ncbi:putative DNA-invertase from lambdoid prophage Rac [termite gut metagenome]|uniref:Putative DNA-invertase from lambdoid prophage Rac n=1 Tax=termite gut metagenome TaxID=433724 RepID=A0A5J4SPV7_9ZZZZ
MIYGYVRVSTDKQDCENQKLGVNAKAQQLELTVQKWIEDNGVSGTKEPEERALGGLLKKVKKGDTIIISELSRFGRSLYMVMRILEGLSKNEVNVYSHKDNFKLDNTIESKVLAFAFSLAAEIERDMISRRTKEALARKRKDGAVLGRPLGAKSAKRKLDDKEQQIVEYLKKGLSYSAIARMTGTHRLTICDFIKRNELEKHKTCYKSNKVSVKKKLLIKSITKDVAIENEALIDLYKKHFSFESMGKEMGLESRTLVSILKRRGIYDKIKEINEQQRIKIKSRRQIERENEKNVDRG